LKEYTVFRNAPIKEALLDVRVELPNDVDLKKLEMFHSFVKERFPERQERKFIKAEIKLLPEIASAQFSNFKWDCWLPLSFPQRKKDSPGKARRIHLQ